jgi:hypothetical protein
MTTNKLNIFTAEDFIYTRDYPVNKIAEHCNAKLNQWLDKQVVVYRYTQWDDRNWYQDDIPKHEPTHTAILCNITKIEGEGE